MDGAAAVRRLLAFARPTFEEPSADLPVGELLRDVARLTAPRWRDAAQAEGRPIACIVDAADDLVVRGHPGPLRQALTNLVFNAVDALPAGGEIHLRADRQGAHVAVEVTDT